MIKWTADCYVLNNKELRWGWLVVLLFWPVLLVQKFRLFFETIWAASIVGADNDEEETSIISTLRVVSVHRDSREILGLRICVTYDY